MIIHLIAAGKMGDFNNWPSIWKKCYDKFTKSQHDISIWDDKGIEKELREYDNEFYEEYLSKLDIIYQIDYVRYIILDKYGGAYFDLDVELMVDFLPLLHKKTTYFLEGSFGELISNAIMITYKESNIWESIISKAKFNIIQNFETAKQNNYNTIKLIGPLFLSSWVARFWNNQRLQKTSSPNIELLGYQQFNTALSSFSFSKHHSTHIWGGVEENYFK